MQNRPLRPFEQGAHLHVLDWAHSTARYRFQAAGQAQVKAGAKAVVAAGPDARELRLPSLEAAVHAELQKLYALGHATVRSELDHQANGDALPIGLSAEPFTLAIADAQPPSQLLARAQLIASHVAHQILQAVQRGRLGGVSGKRRLRALGEVAGNAALSASASSHAGGTINAGRRAAALLAAPPRAQIIGARYTSVLDKNTCGPCADADTGQLLALDSPEWVPTPNPACDGGDRCRCIHIYQLSTEVRSLPVPIAAGG